MNFSKLKESALNKLKGNWATAIGTLIVLSIASGIAGQLTDSILNSSGEVTIAGLGSLIVFGPIGLGTAIFMLALVKKREAVFENGFQGFKNFQNSFILGVLLIFYTFLWMFLFIIPGIIKWMSYSQAFYIMADDPQIAASEAIKKSQKMMDGHKMEFFMLHLSFIGWALGCVLTLGIGFLWLYPWVEATKAEFYLELKGDDGWELIDEFGVAEE